MPSTLERTAQPERVSTRIVGWFKSPFSKFFLMTAVIVAIALVGFWAICVQQPGASYQPSTTENASPLQTGSDLAQAVQPTGQAAADGDDDPVASDVQAELQRHVKQLADTIGERNLYNLKQLNAAADYVQAEFKSYGYQPKRQTYPVQGIDCFNIDVTIPGTDQTKEIIIVGGHYDSAQGTPGANDNATGTAAMLVLARQFAKTKPKRTLRFVAWTNEEPPYFQNRELMGSWVYAQRCRQRDEDVKGVLSLETMGYYSNEENSQKYPPLISALYPSTGNFVGFVSDIGSRGFQRQVIKVFREHAKIPSEGASLPSAIQGVGWSDHWSFWQEGYPGLMVTDTAPFRYPHYHRATDTTDKINFSEMKKVVDGLKFVIDDLVGIAPNSADGNKSTGEPESPAP